MTQKSYNMIHCGPPENWRNVLGSRCTSKKLMERKCIDDSAAHAELNTTEPLKYYSKIITEFSHSSATDTSKELLELQ